MHLLIYVMICHQYNIVILKEDNNKFLTKKQDYYKDKNKQQLKGITQKDFTQFLV